MADGGGDPFDPPIACLLYPVVFCILSHLCDHEVRKFRQVCHTWASVGGIILSRRNGANKRAHITFENEEDVKHKLGPLDELLSETASPRYLLPNDGGLVISTTSMRTQTTPTLPGFLEKYGNDVKAVEFNRSLGTGDDSLMMNEVKTILQNCKNLLEFAFLPYKAKFGDGGAQQEPDAFRETMRWTPNLPANDFSVNLQRLKLTTLMMHMCHPRHLAVVIASSPNLRDLTFLAPNVETRTNAEVLADWENFQDAINELGGMNQIESLALQDWDLIPNVEMKNLRTVKLFVRGISNVPQSQKITYTTMFRQVTTVQVYLRLPLQTFGENAAIHRFMNRFPSTRTVLVHYHTADPILRDSIEEGLQDLSHHIDASDALFNPTDCLVNENVENLHIFNLRILEFEGDPLQAPVWKPLPNFTKVYPNVKNFTISVIPQEDIYFIMMSIMFKLEDVFLIAQEWKDLRDISVSLSGLRSLEILKAFSRTGFMNRIQNVTLDLVLADTEYDIYIRNRKSIKTQDKALMSAVIMGGSRLQSFKLSGFQGRLRNPRSTRTFMQKVAPRLENLSLEKVNFDELSETGSTLAKNLRIKL